MTLPKPPADSPLLRLIAQQIVREYLAELDAEQETGQGQTEGDEVGAQPQQEGDQGEADG